MGVVRTAPYILLGVVLWVAVLKSGVHATLAGVLIGLCIPMRDPEGGSPLRELEHNLHGPVAFAILPIFAFSNAGLTLLGMSWSDFQDPVTLGVILGTTTRQTHWDNLVCRGSGNDWHSEIAEGRRLAYGFGGGVHLRHWVYDEFVYCRASL